MVCHMKRSTTHTLYATLVRLQMAENVRNKLNNHETLMIPSPPHGPGNQLVIYFHARFTVYRPCGDFDFLKKNSTSPTITSFKGSFPLIVKMNFSNLFIRKEGLSLSLGDGVSMPK